MTQGDAPFEMFLVISGTCEILLERDPEEEGQQEEELLYGDGYSDYVSSSSGGANVRGLNSAGVVTSTTEARRKVAAGEAGTKSGATPITLQASDPQRSMASQQDCGGSGSSGFKQKRTRRQSIMLQQEMIAASTEATIPSSGMDSNSKSGSSNNSKSTFSSFLSLFNRKDENDAVEPSTSLSSLPYDPLGPSVKESAAVVLGTHEVGGWVVVWV